MASTDRHDYLLNASNFSAVLAGAKSDTLTFPGPLIRAHKGDIFRMNVIDQLVDTSMLLSTSIHWHGFFQNKTSWADGPVGVTQCPIAPQHSFLYEFATGEQAGTFCYDIDDESTIITLADWYHIVAPQAEKQIVPTFDATLINGKGRYPGGPATPLEVINVLPNKRYRFRLISISCDPNFTFSIDGHPLTIIEVDSENVQPLVVDEIQIFVGQRYSFILTTNNPVANYWIRATPNVGTIGFDGGINSAILRYQGAPDADPFVPRYVLRSSFTLVT
ncbi:Laccase-2 [Psilocybe cubensis]|uniref:Laccase-2 n=1 Tax=Psilocybe cubensis TaxID=181762 RepID=A0ACB8GPZ6_PSICU|nr:Laccase-2 [Psilocybe cubensis]KAH9477711.1 Laccase-2 [Psilocybe cubensis]